MRIKNKVFKVIAVSEAGKTYQTYIKDFRDAALANSGDYEVLEDIRRETLNVLNLISQLQGDIKYPKKSLEFH